MLQIPQTHTIRRARIQPLSLPRSSILLVLVLVVPRIPPMMIILPMHTPAFTRRSRRVLLMTRLKYLRELLQTVHDLVVHIEDELIPSRGVLHVVDDLAVDDDKA